MQRRKFIIGMGALTAGGAAAVGTGAFDSVEAERTVQVHVAGDADAYLGLQGDDTYVGDDSDDGALTIDLGGPTTGEDGEGFNDEAITEISGVFTITNQSSQGNTIDVSLDESSVQDGVDFELAHDDNLDAGESVDVDVTVDTLDEDPEANDGTLVINANSA